MLNPFFSLRPISKRFPLLAPLCLSTKQQLKHIKNMHLDLVCERMEIPPLSVRLFRHKSLLRRKLGDSLPELQDKKVINLSLSVPFFSGLVINPKQTFSFWSCLKKPTKERGFVDGMIISNGQVQTGIGGGLCQLANLLYWMFLHTPLIITEHHHHQLDIFPDSGRVLPFGSGASIFYNFIDLQAFNPTQQSFMIKIWLDSDFLHGEMWSEKNYPIRYSIKEENHHFYTDLYTKKIFRTNRLVRESFDRETGNLVDKILVTENNSQVLYPVPDERMST